MAAQLPYDEATAQRLAQAGHLDPATLEQMKAGGHLAPASTFSLHPEAGLPLDPGPQPVPPPASATSAPPPILPDAPVSSTVDGREAAPPAGQSQDLAGPKGPEAGHVDPAQLATPPQTPASVHPYDPYKRLGEVEQGFSHELAGAQAAANAGAARATEQASYMDTMQKQLEAQRTQQVQREKERQSFVDEEMEKYRSMSDDLRTNKIDPNHYWADKSTGDKIMAAISIGLGAFGGTLSGQGGNVALDLINRQIDRDIDAQKADISNKQHGLDAQGNLVGMMRQKFGDERQAELAARTFSLENAKLRLEQIASRYTAPEIQGKALQLSGQLEAQIAQNKMQIEQNAHQMAAVMQIQNGGSGGSQVNTEFLPKDVRERVVTMPGGKQALVADPETARKVREFTGSDQAFQKDLQNLKDFAIRNHGTTLDRATVNKGKALAAALQNSYRSMEQMGVFKESEANFMKNLIGDDPTTFYNYVPQLSALEDTAANKRTAFYVAHVNNYKPISFTPAGGR